MKTLTPFRYALSVCLAVFALSASLPASSARAMCCPFPCDDCFITARGQLNLILMDRETDRIRMIPNIRFAGTAEDFALIVPTPTEPTLTPADRRIWGEAALMTAPVAVRRNFGGSDFGCGNSSFATPETAGGFEDDVNVIRTESVGAFIATLVRSEDPDALVAWLNANGYDVDETEAAALAPFAARGWVFTAMKLDTSKPGTDVPIGGWDSNVDPVVFDFAATELEVPLAIIGINRGPDMPIVFYVLDDHRVDLPRFETTYANRLSKNEYRAVQERYPNLAAYLAAGRFLTRIERRFPLSDPMSGSLRLVRAGSDEEFRRHGSSFGGFSLELLLLLASPMAGRLLTRRDRRRAGV